MICVGCRHKCSQQWIVSSRLLITIPFLFLTVIILNPTRLLPIPPRPLIHLPSPVFVLCASLVDFYLLAVPFLGLFNAFLIYGVNYLTTDEFLLMLSIIIFILLAQMIV